MDKEITKRFLKNEICKTCDFYIESSNTCVVKTMKRENIIDDTCENWIEKGSSTIDVLEKLQKMNLINKDIKKEISKYEK